MTSIGDNRLHIGKHGVKSFIIKITENNWGQSKVKHLTHSTIQKTKGACNQTHSDR